MSDEDDYAVGYGKPPLHTRFRKGRSGNPRGRPRAPKTIAALLGAALDQKIPAGGDGRRRRITKREAIVANLVDRSMRADFRATRLLLDMLRRFEGEFTPDAAPAEDPREVLKRGLARLASAMAREAPDPGTGDVEGRPKASLDRRRESDDI